MSSTTSTSSSCPLCYCGRRSMMLISKTEDNLQRRFYRCTRTKANGGCTYFEWIDGEICERGQRVINNLKTTIRKLESELKQTETRANIVALEVKLKEMQTMAMMKALEDELKHKEDELKRNKINLLVLICALVVMLYWGMVGFNCQKELLR